MDLRSPIIGHPVVSDIRVAIDKVVHSSVSSANAVIFSGGFARCADYAVVGARVLTALTDHHYEAVAGGKILDCGGGNVALLSEPRQSRRAARSLRDLSRYHCWIISNHSTQDPSGRAEVVDFTLRHDHLYAKTLGIPFSRQSRPKFLWDWLDAMDRMPIPLREHPAVKSRSSQMWVEPECTNLLRKYEQERFSHINRMVSAALRALADDVEAEFNRIKRPAWGALQCANADGNLTHP